MRDEIIEYLHTNYSTLHMLSEQAGSNFNNLRNEIGEENYFEVDGQVILSDRKFQGMVVTRFEANVYTVMLLRGVLIHIDEMRNFVKKNYQV
jgi:hypothetical protein